MLKNINKNLISQGDRLVLAISGGIDSMVMLDYFNRIKDEMSLTLFVAHIDHQKRNVSYDDALFVKAITESYGIDYYYYQLEDNDEENFHQYAHIKRYDFFIKVAKQTKANKVVLAHHLNDLAETILMRLVRGSSFEGYVGISEETDYKGVQIIRPLLHVSRKCIELYQETYQVAYREDKSNQEDHYTRNRFRHHMMPLLENENPQYLDKMIQFSDYQSLSYQLIEQETTKYLKTIDIKATEITFSAKSFAQQLEIIQIETIKRIINQLTDNQLELSYQNIQDIKSMILMDKSHMSYHLGDKLYIYKSYQTIICQTTPLKNNDYTCIIQDFGQYQVNEHIEALIAKKADKNYDYIYKLCYNDLDLLFPLTIRNRRSGDRLDIQIGTKKLKDFFIDKKVPMKKRNELPLLIDSNKEILFIPDMFSKKQSGNDSIYIHLNIL